jgi:hypothetical protein
MCYGDTKIEINVDEIPADIFATLNTYVSSKVKQMKAGFGDDSSSAAKMETTSNASSSHGSSRPKKKQKK